MTSFGYRLNPRYAIKECLSCGALYTRNCSCSKGNIEYKILVPKLPKNCARYAKCGHPNISESSDDSTNVVNAPREPVVVKQDHGSFVNKIIHTFSSNQRHCFHCKDVLRDGEICQRCTCTRCGSGLSKGLCYICRNNQDSSNDSPSISANSSPNPPHIDKCCCKYGEALDEIFCQQCTCKSCGKGAHIGYKCPSKSFAIHQPPQELSIQEMEDLKQQYLDELQCLSNLEYRDEIKIAELTENLNGDRKLPKYGDEHLDTIPATESDEVIKSSVENLVPILSEFEGIPDTMCDVHLDNNHTPLKAKDHVEIVMNSNDDISSSDDDSLYKENIEYVEASPHDSELVSLEVAEIVISEVEKIEDDNLREKLLNVHLLFPPTDRSAFTNEEFADKLAHIISPPEYDRFYFWNFLDPSELMSVLNSEIRENLLSTTSVNLPIEDDRSPILAYVVWIFLAYLMYPVIPPYLHPFGNEDTIFDPGITINLFYSFKPGLSHRCGAFKKFNTHRSHLNECPMIINGKNTHILDVLFFHFHPLDQL
nr:hypothetical protein [Tanacetum cinerariifolium]